MSGKQSTSELQPWPHPLPETDPNELPSNCVPGSVLSAYTYFPWYLYDVGIALLRDNVHIIKFVVLNVQLSDFW